MSPQSTPLSVQVITDRLALHAQWVRSKGKAGRRAVFDDETLEGFDFSKHVLHGVPWDSQNLSPPSLGVSFRRARLVNSTFGSANLSGCDFCGAQITGGRFRGAITMHDTLWQTAVAQGVDFSGVDFSGARLAGFLMRNCRLQGADFLAAHGVSELTLDTDCRVDASTRLGTVLAQKYHQQLTNVPLLAEEAVQLQKQVDALMQEKATSEVAYAQVVNDRATLQAALAVVKAEANASESVKNRMQEARRAFNQAKEHADKQLQLLTDHKKYLEVRAKTVVMLVLVWLVFLAFAVLGVGAAYLSDTISVAQLHEFRGLMLVAGGVLLSSVTIVLALHALIGRTQRKMLTFSSQVMAVETYDSLIWFASALDPALTPQTIQEGQGPDTQMSKTFQEIKKSALHQIERGMQFKDDHLAIPSVLRDWAKLLREFEPRK